MPEDTSLHRAFSLLVADPCTSPSQSLLVQESWAMVQSTEALTDHAAASMAETPQSPSNASRCKRLLLRRGSSPTASTSDTEVLSDTQRPPSFRKRKSCVGAMEWVNNDFVELLYSELFARAPQAKLMFQDGHTHYRKMTAFLNLIALGHNDSEMLQQHVWLRLWLGFVSMQHQLVNPAFGMMELTFALFPRADPADHVGTQPVRNQ
jgi:hypothetical protein